MSKVTVVTLPQSPTKVKPTPNRPIADTVIAKDHRLMDKDLLQAILDQQHTGKEHREDQKLLDMVKDRLQAILDQLGMEKAHRDLLQVRQAMVKDRQETLVLDRLLVLAMQDLRTDSLQMVLHRRPMETHSPPRLPMECRLLPSSKQVLEAKGR